MMAMTVMTRQYVVYDFQFFMGFSTVYRLGFCIIPHKQLDSLARILVRCKMFVQARCLQARCLWRKKQYFQYRKSHMMNFKLSINRTLKNVTRCFQFKELHYCHIQQDFLWLWSRRTDYYFGPFFIIFGPIQPLVALLH